MKFLSTEYLYLLVHFDDGGETRSLRFQDGEYETDDPAEVATLTAYAERDATVKLVR
jgi:hypothetical protein